MNEIVASGNVVDAEVVETVAETRVLTSREDFIAGLRGLARFYDEHPEVVVPGCEARVYIFPRDAKEVPKYARAFGEASKEYLGDAYFTLNKPFGKLIVLQAAWNRGDVCERVVVGQEEVEQEVIVSKVTELRKVMVDKVEWRCAPVLAPKEVGNGA
jgi:hypothetical protein